MSDGSGSRIAVGTMTGTSIDGLDVAVIATRGRGLELEVEPIAHVHAPLGELAPPLRALAEQVPATSREIAALAHAFGRLHAETIGTLLEACGRTPDLVALHGQTVLHAPPLGWALLDPGPVLAAVNCPVVTGLRVNDLASGGQGAPITPLADWVLFGTDRPRTVVNLGGYCNVTLLPDRTAGTEGLAGRDVCPCNHLLDTAARRWLRSPMDRDGATAARGRPQEALASELASELAGDAGALPQALGTGDEQLRLLDRLEPLGSVPDRLATLVDAVARAITTGFGPGEEVLLFGGGAHHPGLQAGLERHHPAARIRAGSHGVEPETRESVAMAVLGLLARDGIPITVAEVTGRRRRTSHLDGVWHLVDSAPFTED